MVESSVGYALLMSTLAGLSTGLGGLIVVAFGVPSETTLGYILGFSAGVMIAISFLDLIPEAVSQIGFAKANVAFFVGIILFMLLSWLIPEPTSLISNGSGGRSRSRSRRRRRKSESESSSETSESSIRLLRTGIVASVSLALHNFPEGAAVFLSSLRHPHLGAPLLIAIALHNIPEGAAVAAPLLRSTRSPAIAFFLSLLSGLCEPLGASLLALLPIGEHHLGWGLASVAGVMWAMSAHELLPQASQRIGQEKTSISVTIGMAVMVTTVWMLQEKMGFKMTK